MTELKVHCHGQGDAVYLIGGGPAFTTWNLQPIQDRLSARYRVCRWDMRGVGENAGLEVKPGVSALAQWLDDMHQLLPEQPVMLWGHSWGALQALLFARQHPEQVDKLILSNPVDPALRSLEQIEQKRFNHSENASRLKLEEFGTPAEDLHNLRSKVASYFVDPERGWAYASAFTREDANNRLNVRIWEEYRESRLTDSDVRQLAARIRGILYCRDDVLQPEAMNEYKRLLSPDKHHVLAGCAHFPWEEQPDEYFSILIELLGPSRGQ